MVCGVEAQQGVEAQRACQQGGLTQAWVAQSSLVQASASGLGHAVYA